MSLELKNRAEAQRRERLKQEFIDSGELVRVDQAHVIVHQNICRAISKHVHDKTAANENVDYKELDEMLVATTVLERLYPELQ